MVKYYTNKLLNKLTKVNSKKSKEMFETLPDFVIIMVMGFPMLLFTVFPALKLGDYLEERYGIDEKQKRTVVVIATIVVTLTLSSILFYA